MKTFFAIIGALILVPILIFVLPAVLVGAGVLVIAFWEVFLVIAIIAVVIHIIRKRK